MRRMRWILAVLTVFLVAACQQIPPVPTAPVPTAVSSVIPSAAPTEDTLHSSPLPIPTTGDTFTSPLAASPAAPAGVRFEIDRPVTARDSVVKGSGLPGVAIEVQDVTRMGVILGGAVIGDDGRFEIPVPSLTPNVRIGISLAEPNDEIWANKDLLGPQPLVMPLAGIYLDTVSVQP